MKQLIKDFIRTAKEQIFGEELPREGKIVLTKKAFLKIAEWALSKETLELTFQYGTKTKQRERCLSSGQRVSILLCRTLVYRAIQTR